MKCEKLHFLKIIETTGYMTKYKCSVCGAIITVYLKDYVRICGNIVKEDKDESTKNTLESKS